MEKLTNQELKNVKGGISVWIGLGLGALTVFLSGLLDGIMHPKACEGGNYASH